MRISLWQTAVASTSDEGYADIFDPHSSHLQPVNLDDGTSIAWPPGWSQKDADLWRRAIGLVRPAFLRQRGSC